MNDPKFTPAAMHDLADIFEYIAQENEPAAVGMLERLFRSAELLAESPKLGRMRGEDLRPGLRSYPVGNYTLFYRCTDGGVEILRVLHGSRDLPPFFQ